MEYAAISLAIKTTGFTVNIPVKFNAQTLMFEIKNSEDISSHEKDKCLAFELQKINLSGEDGNCRGCAFHTCMALLGFGTRLAPRPNKISEYMSYFYTYHHDQIIMDEIIPKKRKDMGNTEKESKKL